MSRSLFLVRLYLIVNQSNVQRIHIGIVKNTMALLILSLIFFIGLPDQQYENITIDILLSYFLNKVSLL